MKKAMCVLCVMVAAVMVLAAEQGGNTVKKKGEDSKAKPTVPYADKIKFTNMKVDTGLIQGEVKNTGDKQVTKIRVHVTLFNAKGEAVHEYESDLHNISGTEPLKPNYSTKFSVYPMNAPSEWSGKFDLDIVKLDAN